jgi:hypothetical protein
MPGAEPGNLSESSPTVAPPAGVLTPPTEPSHGPRDDRDDSSDGGRKRGNPEMENAATQADEGLRGDEVELVHDRLDGLEDAIDDLRRAIREARLVPARQSGAPDPQAN